MTVPTFHYSRIVDLSRPLVPSEGQHPWVRFETQIEALPNNRLLPHKGRHGDARTDKRCRKLHRGRLHVQHRQL